ncbi:3-oxoacyl-[acyl-carrier protein] reductase [Kroppenstedtia sanguinis]|uniref:3-oxoacyl-ACP reductase family protein n=1 Tax=Kroppenstedtia sanguinis TaxID=1380684 RepID=UPI003D2568C4
MMLRDKTVVVTGGSRGIGRQIACTLSKEGASVVINYVKNKEEAESTLQQIRRNGGIADIYRADIADEKQAQELIEFTCHKYGQVDVLVNNAGITRDSLLIQMPAESWDKVIRTNLRGPFLSSKYSLRKMLRQRSGKIINISSICGLLGNAGQANYSASKAGIIGLTKSIAQEYSSKGITANVVSPGPIKTEMTLKVPEEIMKQKVESTMMQRPGSAKEVSHVVLFLASCLGDYVNGEVIRVDGGIKY